MSRRARFLTTGVVAIGLLGCLLAPARAADDDFEFAQALYQRGYTDLAEEKFLELLNDPKRSSAEKGEGQYGLALLKRFNALVAALETAERRRKPLPAVLGFFDEADAAFAQFIERNPSHPRVLSAKLDRAKMIQDRADYVNRAIENDWVPSDITVADLKAQVAEGYNTAIGLLEANERKARSTYEAARIGSPERAAAEDELGLVWLYRISALHGKGSALPQGDTSGQAALNTALAEIDEFMWIFDGTVRGLWAFHYGGLVNWRLDKPSDAMQFMRDAATALKETDGVGASKPITFRSFRELGRIALDVSDRHGDEYLRSALKTMDRLATDWPSYLDHPDGQRAALMHARLLDRSGDSQAALAIVEAVIQKAKATNSRVDVEAGKALAEMMGGGSGTGSLPPELLADIALSKYRESNYRDAIRAYQSVLGACNTPERMNEHGWSAWNLIGQCYWLTGRWYEAHMVFDILEKAWVKDPTNEKLKEITDTTGFSRAQTLDKLAGETKDPAEKARLGKLAKQYVDDFAEEHPDSPLNVGAEEAAAANKLREARQLLRSDPELAKTKLREALAALEAIDPSSELFDKIEAQKAQIHKLLGDYDKALAMSKAWLAKKRPPATESRVRRARLSGNAIALTTILTSLIAKADLARESGDVEAKNATAQAVLEGLSQYEAEFIKNTTTGQRLVDTWRAEALIGLGEAQKADELVSKLMENARDEPNTKYLAALVAKAREAEAIVWKAKDDLQRYRDLMHRAAKLREYVVIEGKTPTPESLISVAKTFGKAGESEKAEKYLLDA